VSAKSPGQTVYLHEVDSQTQNHATSWLRIAHPPDAT
jgi:hypothetical protein